jgi:flagellar hook assembly protein FlgD
MIWTFSVAPPPSAAVTALERLLEWKLDVHHVDPQGTATLVCGYGEKFRTGQRVKFPAIAGHRDANYTDCPGDRLYRVLPAARAVAARRGQPKIYGFIVEIPAISPNGDGVVDHTTVGFTVSQTASWRVEIRDKAGKMVRHVTGEGKVVTMTWAGRDDDGKELPDGVYTLEAGATNASGEARSATDVVRLDTVAPRVRSADVAPDSFSPNGDGADDRATFSYEPSENGTARVSIVTPGGRVLRRLTAWKVVTASERRVAWDGRVTSGDSLAPASEGPAAFEVEVRDVAGNTATARRSVTVDRTLKLTSLSRTVFSPNADGKYDSVDLGFDLTRPAEVTVAVVHGGDSVRTMRLGSLAAGRGSVTWDGGVGGGVATSGTYRLKVTADGSLGATSATRDVVVDLSAPALTAPASAAVRLGKTAKIAYRVRDAYSPMVKVTVLVTDAAGETVATIACGWVKQGVAQTCAWRPRARGTYTLTFSARDQGSNLRTTAATTTLRAR